MGGTVTDTAANMVSMMSFLIDLEWAGCANHIIQLIVNVSTISQVIMFSFSFISFLTGDAGWGGVGECLSS